MRWKWPVRVRFRRADQLLILAKFLSGVPPVGTLTGFVGALLYLTLPVLFFFFLQFVMKELAPFVFPKKP